MQLFLTFDEWKSSIQVIRNLKKITSKLHYFILLTLNSNFTINLWRQPIRKQNWISYLKKNEFFFSIISHCGGSVFFPNWTVNYAGGKLFPWLCAFRSETKRSKWSCIEWRGEGAEKSPSACSAKKCVRLQGRVERGEAKRQKAGWRETHKHGGGKKTFVDYF